MSRHPQGWDQADFSCGRCPLTFTATSEDEYVYALSVHQTAHSMVDLMVPALREQIAELLAQEVSA